MKRVIPTAVLLILVLASVRVVAAQIGNSSQGQRAVAKSATNAATVQKNPESNDATSEKTPGANVSAQKYYESGTGLYASGKIEEAIEAFKQATKLQPDDAQAHYMLGMAHSKSKAYKESFESFKRAIRFWPDWPQAHYRLGVISYVLGRRPQSVEAYNNLLRLESPLANTLYRIIKDDDNQATLSQGAMAGDWSLTQTELIRAAAPAKEAPNAGLAESNRVPSTNGDSGSTAPSPASAISETAPTVIVPPAAISETAPIASVPPAAISEPAPTASVPPAAISETAPPASDPPAATEDTAALTGIYKVGVGDVLDIRVLNSSTARSTLYTVIDGGLIDLAIIGGPITVAGLTTEAIQALIAAELKRRAIEEGARVSVGVRQYASHSVIITGLVNNPGTKFLRREAIPLYVLMAEAQARLDAGRVAIMRPGSAGLTLDLGDPAALNFLIRPGDMISVAAKPQEFYYIAGRITNPGQKVFQPGVTLLQAILAAGGVMRDGDKIEISREVQDGRLATTTFKLKEIKAGKIQDPRLQPGDRIEVIR